MQWPFLGPLVKAGLRSARNHDKDMAASIAFFGFLSIFPLLIGGMAIAGQVLKSERLRNQVIELVVDFFPVGADVVTENIETVVSLRGAATLFSIVLLFWSARKMFT